MRKGVFVQYNTVSMHHTISHVQLGVAVTSLLIGTEANKYLEK